MHTHKQDRHGHDGLEAILQHYHLNMRVSESTDAQAIRDVATELLAEMRANGRPGMFIGHCYRYLEHVGVNEDFHDNYRPREEYEAWLKRDPVSVLRASLLTQGVDRDAVECMERAVIAEIDDAVVEAQQAPFLDVCYAGAGVFACE